MWKAMAVIQESVRMHHGPDIIRVHSETVQGIGVVGVMIRIGSLSPTLPNGNFNQAIFIT